jgi:hypothetical protein
MKALLSPMFVMPVLGGFVMCGVTAVLLQAEASRAARTRSAAPPASEPAVVSYEQVLTYLKLEVNQHNLLALLERSPAALTLDESQLEELTRLGATPAILAAVQKRAPNAAPDTLRPRFHTAEN